jgi:hypothetical protein
MRNLANKRQRQADNLINLSYFAAAQPRAIDLVVLWNGRHEHLAASRHGGDDRTTLLVSSADGGICRSNADVLAHTARYAEGCVPRRRSRGQRPLSARLTETLQNFRSDWGANHKSKGHNCFLKLDRMVEVGYF